AYGHDQLEDWLVLAGVLHIRAGHLKAIGAADRAAVMLDEATAIFDAAEESAGGHDLLCLATALSQLADQGDEDAALRLNRIMEKLSPSEAASVRSSVDQAVREMAALVRH